jgi:tyrosyl-tRNA synthetase
MKNFLDILRSRHFLAQIAHPEEFATHISEQPRWAYAGFDPTADSLHVGNLIPIMALRRWQQAGHNAVVLMGGATALVGDPTGKSELRQMQNEETINSRIAKLQPQFARFLDTDPKRFRIVNNADWFKSKGYLEILSEIGTDFTVNRMLAAECFKNRYEKGLSFLEFNYMILQSYDFLHLSRTFGVSVQIGGDDQWSNMIGGMDLIRRKSRQQAFIATNPLLVTTSGAKMGKTEKGAIWLDAAMTSPFELFQYFRNVEDDMVAKCLLYFTDTDPAEISNMTGMRDATINQAKILLATEITKLIHGEQESLKAKEQAQNLFNGSGNKDAPEVFIEVPGDATSLSIIDIVVLAKICESKGEARRLIEQGGLVASGKKVTDAKMVVEVKALKKEGLLVAKGKKHFFQIRLK